MTGKSSPAKALAKIPILSKWLAAKDPGETHHIHADATYAELFEEMTSLYTKTRQTQRVARGQLTVMAHYHSSAFRKCATAAASALTRDATFG